MDNKNGGYLLGILGGFVAGMVATIPWVLVYVYLNYILSLLAILVAVAVLKGYQFMKGKVDKKLPIIISVISVACISIATLYLIPKFLIIKEGYHMSVSLLYNNSDFSSAIIKDYITSLLFTFLGISGVVTSVKRQVKSGKTQIDLKADNLEYLNQQKEYKEKIINVFKKYKATNKDTSVTKDQIFNELDFDDKQGVFNLMIRENTIVKKKSLYYYNENNTKNSNSKVAIIVSIIISISVLVGIIIGTFESNSTDNFIDYNTSYYSMSINNNYIEKFYDDKPNMAFYLPKKDTTWQSGVISISLYDTDDNDYLSFKDSISSYISEQLKEYSYKIEDYTTKNGYKSVLVTVDYKDGCIEKMYYIMGDKIYAFVYSTQYPKNKKVKNVDKTTNQILDSFKWK